MSPRVKSFIWLLLQGKIKTYDFLYRLNLGPLDNCVFCGLVPETSDHLFRTCRKSLEIWRLVEHLTNRSLDISDHFELGIWLDFSLSSHSWTTASLIAATLWYIWKARCDSIFRNIILDPSQVARTAAAHSQDFKLNRADYNLIKYLVHNGPRPGHLGVFSASAWNVATGKCGGGFILVDSDYKIVCAGFGPARLDSKVAMEAMALMAALRLINEDGGRCSHIFTSSMELWTALFSNEEVNLWRHSNCLDELCHLLGWLNWPRMELIHHAWNKAAAALAGKGINAVGLSLFHQGMEKPHWLMKILEGLGFHA